jgi:hypothetical protein
MVNENQANENQDEKKQNEEKQNEFDRALNAALAKYASAEPRMGLEERLLANLRAERARAPERAWWRWSLAGALAVVLVVALAFAWKLNGTSHPVVQNHSPSTKQEAQQSTQVVSKASMSDHGLQDRLTPRRATLHRPPKVVVAGNPKLDQPKLDQFPSPQPLSEGERLLVRYVQDFPQEAEMIAKEQAEFEQEMEKLNGDHSLKANSDQKER